jgi:hypothetical protein
LEFLLSFKMGSWNFHANARLLVVRPQTIAAARTPDSAPASPTAESMKDTTTAEQLLSSQMSILQ